MQIELKSSLKVLLYSAAFFGVYKTIMFIFLLVVGVVADVATSGSVSVPSGINDTINSTVTSVSDGYALINLADAIVLGLIGLVVILKIFWPVISPYLGGGKKGKGGYM